MNTLRKMDEDEDGDGKKPARAQASAGLETGTRFENLLKLMLGFLGFFVSN